ncbi:hypothetical protein [Candidatus Chloroploca sp. Khr17]|uniref:hypothetical protein n=1 Tax=Candidatus Chloroploca sp. Khr17 TaxID=2496869 RepID=UPI00101C38A0|nr:hypothetical protein [Candidatus Chloroploca sp. Khr17]
MSLLDLLYEALETVEGARFAGVVGTDGLGVEMVYADDDDEFDLELAELELATLAANAGAASKRIGSGRVYDLTVETDELTYLASLVTPGYFAVLGLYADASLDGARATLAELVERIQVEV